VSEPLARAVDGVDSERHSLKCGDVLSCLEELAADRFRLIISSPPYNIGKDYEKDSRRTIDEYVAWQADVAQSLFDLLEDDGSLCWQVGNFVRDGVYVPLDIALYPAFSKIGFQLRNRIIWRFNFGLNADRRLSGRYETLLWFTKSDNYKFNLDPIRIPQIYPGKRHSSRKGAQKAGPAAIPWVRTHQTFGSSLRGNTSWSSQFGICQT
jgi:DNA modification methylase